ncbi:zona pellucida sperm-binding protein 3-like [Ascaphus truei]|uniref:zona pellucida sperm-binding protein 3-like n=1 Tax=Ascaphus truei TaxID=8439 RepID=UPI003F5AAD8A
MEPRGHWGLASPIKGRHWRRNTLLTALAISLALILGLLVVGLTKYSAMATEIEALKEEQQRVVALGRLEITAATCFPLSSTRLFRWLPGAQLLSVRAGLCLGVFNKPQPNLAIQFLPCGAKALSWRCTNETLLGLHGNELYFNYGNNPGGLMTPDWLVYNTNLTYSPTPSRNSPIIRTNPAVVLIQCYYPRYDNVSSKPIKPTWVPFSSTVSVEEKLSFSLFLMTDDWSSQRTSTVFQLGDIFHIEASVDTGNHVPMTIYVDSCVATLSPDVNSNPGYEIIALNGCLLDGKLEDSSSAFISPRPQPDKLQFMIDAFRFTGIDASMIYITCHLRAAAATQAPNSLNKACSFSKSSNIWSPVEGPSNTCSCCETGNCAATAGQSRRNNPPQNRRPWRREAALGPDSEQAFATLGPLLVVGPPHNKASATRQESKQMAEIWMLVAVGVLCLVVISTCIIVTVSRISKRRVFLQTVQK